MINDRLFSHRFPLQLQQRPQYNNDDFLPKSELKQQTATTVNFDNYFAQLSTLF